MTRAWTKVERDGQLERLWGAALEYDDELSKHFESLGVVAEIGVDPTSSAYVETPALLRARAAFAEATALEGEYFSRLPRLVAAPCPFCAKPLHRTFDPFGADGLWWRSDATPEEPSACPHFCVVLGAVDLGGAAPPTPRFDVHLGPGVPYVVPRLMSLDGMTAVVSRWAMEGGAAAHVISYFAPRRPPVQSLTAPWPRTNFVYTTQLGAHGWRRWNEPPAGSPPDLFDFDLAPWVEQRRVLWCDPASDRTRLSAQGSEGCPFVGLTGERTMQVLPAG